MTMIIIADNNNYYYHQKFLKQQEPQRRVKNNYYWPSPWEEEWLEDGPGSLWRLALSLSNMESWKGHQIMQPMLYLSTMKGTGHLWNYAVCESTRLLLKKLYKFKDGKRVLMSIVHMQPREKGNAKWQLEGIMRIRCWMKRKSLFQIMLKAITDQCARRTS